MAAEVHRAAALAGAAEPSPVDCVCMGCKREQRYAPGTACYWCAAKLCLHCKEAADRNKHVCHVCKSHTSKCHLLEGRCVLGCGTLTTSEPGVAAIGNTFSAAATGAVDATAHEAYAPPDTGTAASSSAFEWSKFPNELLLKVFSKVKCLRDVIALTYVCKRWALVSFEDAVWRRIAQLRWPSISSRRRNPKDHIDWRLYYQARHDTEHQRLIPIEDCMKSKCPYYWERLRGPTYGRSVKARKCSTCVKYVLNCQSEKQLETCQDYEWLDEHAMKSFQRKGPERGIAYPAVQPPSAEEDWGFATWYFGTISREVACYLLERGPIGSFLVRAGLSGVDNYVLSVKCPNAIEHVRVMKGREGYQLGALHAFPSVASMIEHYENNSLAEEFDEARTMLTCSPPQEELESITPEQHPPANLPHSYLAARTKKLMLMLALGERRTPSPTAENTPANPGSAGHFGTFPHSWPLPGSDRSEEARLSQRLAQCKVKRQEYQVPDYSATSPAAQLQNEQQKRAALFRADTPMRKAPKFYDPRTKEAVDAPADWDPRTGPPVVHGHALRPLEELSELAPDHSNGHFPQPSSGGMYATPAVPVGVAGDTSRLGGYLFNTVQPALPQQLQTEPNEPLRQGGAVQYSASPPDPYAYTAATSLVQPTPAMPYHNQRSQGLETRQDRDQANASRRRVVIEVEHMPPQQVSSEPVQTALYNYESYSTADLGASVAAMEVSASSAPDIQNYCTFCGTKAQPTWRFCGGCGAQKF